MLFWRTAKSESESSNPYKIIPGCYLAFIVSYRALCPLPSWVATTSTFLVFAVGRTEHRTSTCKTRLMVMVIMIMVIMMIMVKMDLDDGIGLGWPNSIQLSTKLPRSKFTALAPQSQSIPKFLIPGSDPSLLPISQTDRFIQVGRLTKKGTLMHHAVNVLLHKEPDESEPHLTLRCGRNTFLMLLKNTENFSDISTSIVCRIFEKYFTVGPILR